MALIDRKIAAFTKTISMLADRIRNQGTDVKAWFDSSPEELRQALNGTIDDIVAADYATKTDLTNRKLSESGDFTGTWGTETKASVDGKIATAVSNSQSALTQATTAADTVNQFDSRITTAESNSQSAATKTSALETQFNQLVINAGDSNAEIVAARVKEDGTAFDSLPLRLNASDSDFEAHKSDTTNGINSKFLSRLMNGLVTKIKLIGDSITDGNGARNYSSPPTTNPIIFDDGAGNVFYEPSNVSTCWANMFRNFIVSDYPSVQFVNAGIGGKSAKWANANKTNWISDTEDVVFVMLGTNDRWDCATPAEFKIELESFLSYVKAKCNLMVVMTAPPTLSDTDTVTYHFGMKEVDKVITEVCQRNQYIHISQYREILSFSERSGAILQSLIEDMGSHPINEGYDAMWKITQERLGFIDNLSNWKNSNTSALYTVLVGSQVPYVLSTTPITFFEKGKKTVIEIDSCSDISNFPEPTTGWLTVTRGTQNDLSSFQTYEPRESYNIYKRTWNYGSSSWNAWKQLNASATSLFHDKHTVSVTPGSITANTVADFELLVIGIDSTYTPIATVIGTLPTGIIVSTHVDYTANRFYLRIHNATASAITVGALNVVCVQMNFG